ncbi:hypothetical protein ABID22_004016 [Pontibacter aydingkolensis]|uniref:Uncharacterized protein n=1 Tax=Pontibacter aydingkolensis TaxID=1911536 RepID=A0ABS7CZP5_9BACT|nr:hypothetical protein [Pontibacter aydingkolensis]MBW7469260.1 hypothetical protein [Pontibacter aydingkolensis]
MQEFSMFERLPFRSQEEALAKGGTMLAQRKHNVWTVTLYFLNNSFVELWSGETVQVYSTFKKSANVVDILEPYADEVDVGDLQDLW